MSRMTDNESLESFAAKMVKQNMNARKRNIPFCSVFNKSQREIIACWNAGVPFYYKDFRTNTPECFIRANSDGSEDLVRQVIRAGARTANDIEYELLSTLSGAFRGLLYCHIYGRTPSPRRKDPVNSPVAVLDF